MINDFTHYDFSFNKNGNFVVRYDGVLLRRDDLVSACADYIHLLNLRIIYFNSNSDKKYLVRHLNPSGFNYKELKAFLFILLRDYTFLLHCDDVIPHSDDVFSRLNSDRSKYLGHIPATFLLEDTNEDLYVDCVAVKDVFEGLYMYTCSLYGHSFCASDINELKRRVLVGLPNLSKHYNLIIKVRE